jgi:hypothetical protein
MCIYCNDIDCPPHTVSRQAILVHRRNWYLRQRIPQPGGAAHNANDVDGVAGDLETIHPEHPDDDPDDSNSTYASEDDNFDGGRSTFYTTRIEEVDHRMS